MNFGGPSIFFSVGFWGTYILFFYLEVEEVHALSLYLRSTSFCGLQSQKDKWQISMLRRLQALFI